MPETAADWLRRNALGHLVKVFESQRISVDLFSDLTEADLADLKLTIGDRKVFLRALRKDANSGTAAPASAKIPAATGPAVTGIVSERRFLTVVFIDLVGSTALSTQIDAEDLHEVLRSYLGTVKAVTNSFGGHVLKYLGDGVMSIFGWPLAHEDQGERAVLMTLEVVRAVQALAPRPDLNLNLRIGIASGAMVVGDIVDDVNDITGAAANLAQRLQSHAEPGEIVIDEATRTTLPNGFVFAELGSLSLKGFSDPVTAFRVESAPTLLSKQGQPSPFEQPIVGRNSELEALDDLWASARQGHGRTVIVQGDPGIGKTRLVGEFLQHLPKTSNLTLHLQCFEYRSVSAMYPLQQALKHNAGIQREDDTASRRKKLSRFLHGRCANPELAFALFAVILSIADEKNEDYLVEHVPDRVRLALELFVEMTLNAAKDVPLVINLEDAHWADPTTLTYCSMLSRQIGERQILLVITTRPEWGFPQITFTNAELILLEKLKRDDSRRIVEQAVGTQLSPTTFEAILQRGEDTPLYLEELARVAADGDSGDDLPISIQSSLLSRVDRLGSDRPIIQLLAVLGHTFSLESLHEVSNYDKSTLVVALARLVDAGMLERKDHSNRYQFRHALIQEAAYASVLRRTKGKLHNQVAEALLNRLENQQYADPEVLARHLSLASRAVEAIPFWQAAGDRLAGQSAHTEAAQLYEKGLADAATLPAGPERDECECELLFRLSAALLTVEGWSAQRVEKNYEAALVLSHRLGDPRKQFVAMRGRFNVLLLRGDLTGARALVGELNQVARQTEDAVLIAEAFKIDGGCAVHEADFRHAARCLDDSIRIFTRSSAMDRAIVFGTDLVVISLVHLAWANWFLGDTELADKNMGEALKVARSGKHAFSEAYAEGFASCLQQFRADPDGAMHHAENTIALSKKYHFHYFEGWGRILRGWSMTFLGSLEPGLQEIDRGIDIYRGTGAELIVPYACALRQEARQFASGSSLVTILTEDDNGACKTSSQSRFYNRATVYENSGDGEAADSVNR